MPYDAENDEADDFDLGDHAEDRFQSWCGDVNILATRPKRDKKGWDFHLVLPTHRGGSPVDAPPRLNCAVQVKGQWLATTAPPQIKLSNWHTMISEPIPWFVCIVWYDKPRSPVRAALVHIGQRWIEKAMKELWENEASPKKAQLHKRTLAVTWDTADILPTLDGKSVLRAIRAHIGDTQDYVNNKIKWRLNAGIEDARHAIAVSISKRQLDYKLLSDIALGDKRSIPISEVKASELRFGIPIERTRHRNVLLTFEPRPLTVTATVIFTCPSPTENFEILFQIYSTASIFPFLPPKHRRVRLVAPHLRLEISPRGKSGSTYRWDLQIPREKLRLDEIARAARAMLTLMDSRSPRPQLRIGTGKATPIDVTTSPPPVLPRHVRCLLEAAVNAETVGRSFGLAVDKLYVSRDRLIHDRDSLILLASVFNGSSPEASIALREKRSRKHDGAEMGYVLVQGARLGDWYIFLSIGLVGKGAWKEDGGGYLSISPKSQILEKKVIAVNSINIKDFTKKVLQPMRNRGEAELKKRKGINILRIGK